MSTARICWSVEPSHLEYGPVSRLQSLIFDEDYVSHAELMSSIALTWVSKMYISSQVRRWGELWEGSDATVYQG